MNNGAKGRQRYCRSALFVDFDNVYLRLEQQDSSLAASFATQPGHWTDWLEQALPVDYDGAEWMRRRILVRRCYLNPRSFGRYRAYFIRSAFETIDCPALTAQGKTSADVYMVLDILDLLAHKTYFDEFILMSADADFTPVLLKLRKHDRRAVVLAIGPSSSAYTSASDLLINQDEFIDVLSGPAEEPEPVAVTGAVPVELPRSSWDAYSQVVREQVGGAPAPVSLAALAQRLRSAYPGLETDWGGCGSFNALLSRLDLGRCVRSPFGPGYLYDPERHSPPASVDLAADDGFARGNPQMAEVARRVSQLTDTPYLAPEHYAELFHLIEADINANGYHMTRVSKAVRDGCKERGVPVSRQQVNFILRGLAFSGHRLGEKEESAEELARMFHKNTLNLCARAQLELTTDEEQLMSKWLTGREKAEPLDQDSI